MIYILTFLIIVLLTDLRFAFSKLQFIQYLAFLNIDGSSTYYQRLEFFAKSKLKLEALSQNSELDNGRISEYVKSHYRRVTTFCSNFASFKNRIVFIFGTELKRKKMISDYGNSQPV